MNYKIDLKLLATLELLGLASFLRPLASLEVSGGPRLLRLLGALKDVG